MSLQTSKRTCNCGMRSYPTREAAERALAKIQGLALRDTMPKAAVECWRGLWHLEGAKKVETGPDKHTRAVVIERDVWACAACGKPIDVGPYSLQHRLPRGAGGTGDPEINSPANLVTLCGTATSGCHLAAEARSDLMHELGFYLERRLNERPETTPVRHHAYGWCLLGMDGTIIPVPGGAA